VPLNPALLIFENSRRYPRHVDAIFLQTIIFLFTLLCSISPNCFVVAFTFAGTICRHTQMMPYPWGDQLTCPSSQDGRYRITEERKMPNDLVTVEKLNIDIEFSSSIQK
jgi:hypothetical protein